MDDVLTKLEGYLQQLNDIGDDIRRTGDAWRKEREERERLGLTGDAAIKHYNDWMDREGMPELKVKSEQKCNSIGTTHKL